MQQSEDRQGGGPVTGQGDWNSDNIETKTSPGEEVIPANVRAYYGQPFFDRLIENFEQKTGQKRGTNQAGQPPSPQAQASFQRTQGGDPDDDTQQPEASNPAQIKQGTPLMAAGPTMSPVMAMGGQVPNLGQMKDDDLVQHARMSKARGNRPAHDAAVQEIGRRLRGGRDNAPDSAVSIGGQRDPDAPYAMGGRIPTSVGPIRAGSSRISGGGGGGIRVPPVRAVGGIGAQPQTPIDAPGPRPQGMPTPPAVTGNGPPMAVAPPQPMQRSAAPLQIASPSASGVPLRPRTALGGIGVRR